MVKGKKMKKKEIMQNYTSEKMRAGYDDPFAFALAAIHEAVQEIRAGRQCDLYSILEKVTSLK